ncbi:sporulation protein YlmC with PRC-barrel domain [Rhodopirellula rubra]|uniref:Sporulation protein YlmC with PRC-barrel domain n=1 Tax=Aporhodopirellula rubra TaxID=980271 RepID=A0A7W5E2U4_9BACT|nr:PRC-barrel domain-containing protein [Aporhodopirellula rubra]MBB3209195.1 sporulation protein YlmC with PRC-barrel domain [Aporhodopirellula rubra]
MKRFTRSLAICSIATFGFTGLAPVNADEHQVGHTSGSNVGTLDDVTASGQIRASQLIGQNIYNKAEESIGEINDVVMDASTGKIAYVAVSYGGMLGLGDSLFAVPFKAFKCTKEQDGDDYHMCLDVTKQQLENAKGFNQDRWPAAADKQFMAGLNKMYNVKDGVHSQSGVHHDIQQ